MENYPNCIPIGESRVMELEEKEEKFDSLKEERDKLREHVRILREALTDMLNQDAMHHAGQTECWMTPTSQRARAALEATKEGA